VLASTAADESMLSVSDKDTMTLASEESRSFYNRVMKAPGTGIKDLYSGLIRIHVLHHACEEGIFGLGMIQELRRHGYRLGPGTIYPLLHGMESRGLVRSSFAWINGRRRKVYYGTRAGRRVLAEAKKKVRELANEIFEHDRKNRP
jgi:PadR family transcriptional regulator PadR